MTAFLDTSFLLRYFTGQPADIALIARDVIDGPGDLSVSPVILAEAGYALTQLLHVPRAEAVDHLVSFISRQNVHVSGMEKALAAEALLLCRPSGRVSFADALLWADAYASRQPVYTFDDRFPAEGIEILRSAP